MRLTETPSAPRTSEPAGEGQPKDCWGQGRKPASAPLGKRAGLFCGLFLRTSVKSLQRTPEQDA